MTVNPKISQRGDDLSNIESLIQWEGLYDFLSRYKKEVRDPFWERASFALIEETMKKKASQGNLSLKKFYIFLKGASIQEIEAFFEGTKAEVYASAKNEKSTATIRSYLISEIERFFQAHPLFPSGKLSSHNNSYKN